MCDLGQLYEVIFIEKDQDRIYVMKELELVRDLEVLVRKDIVEVTECFVIQWLLEVMKCYGYKDVYFCKFFLIVFIRLCSEIRCKGFLLMELGQYVIEDV